MPRPRRAGFKLGTKLFGCIGFLSHAAYGQVARAGLLAIQERQQKVGDSSLTGGKVRLFLLTLVLGMIGEQALAALYWRLGFDISFDGAHNSKATAEESDNLNTELAAHRESRPPSSLSWAARLPVPCCRQDQQQGCLSWIRSCLHSLHRAGAARLPAKDMVKSRTTPTSARKLSGTEASHGKARTAKSGGILPQLGRRFCFAMSALRGCEWEGSRRQGAHLPDQTLHPSLQKH